MSYALSNVHEFEGAAASAKIMAGQPRLTLEDG